MSHVNFMSRRKPLILKRGKENVIFQINVSDGCQLS